MMKLYINCCVREELRTNKPTFGTCSKSLVSLFRNYKKETMLSNNYDEIKMAGFLLKNELQYE